MEKKHFVILGNEDPADKEFWRRACEAFPDRVDYSIVDLTRSDWLDQINRLDNIDYLLTKPGGMTSLFTNLYQERIDILVHDLGYKVFPSYDEIRIYENKRFFAYWAEANQVPHPKTYVFYHQSEANKALPDMGLPLVGKMNVGASGNGVVILKDSSAVKAYIEKAFHEGLTARTGPRLDKGKYLQRAWEKMTHPKALLNKLKTYRQIAADKQRGFVILQKFIPHEYEWRVVRIGDSFFAHKKLKRGDKASGTLLKNYDNPPLEIFDFVKSLTDRFNFYSVAIDLFEGRNANDYLVNEIQCIFGQSDPYQMLVDGHPGRYRWIDGKWQFEKGNFNDNESYNHRVEFLLEMLTRTSNEKTAQLNS